MSARTRQKQHATRKELPVETDWLWSCSSGITLGDIGRQLGFTNEPRTSLSAHAWSVKQRMRADLYSALMHADSQKMPTQDVNWDALDEILRDACANGRLLVIRDLSVDVPESVQMLIDIIGFRRGERGAHVYENRPGTRFALVLEGWTFPDIRVRSRRATRYMVRGVSDPARP